MQHVMPDIRQIQQWSEEFKEEVQRAKPLALFDLGLWADSHDIRQQCYVIVNHLPVRYVQMHNMRFYKAQFHGAQFTNCEFKDVTFSHCGLDEAVFDNNLFDNCTFENCRLTQTSIRSTNKFLGTLAFNLSQLSSTTLEEKVASYPGTVADRSVLFSQGLVSHSSKRIPGAITQMQHLYEAMSCGISFAGLNLSQLDLNLHHPSVCKYEILPHLTLRTHSKSLFNNGLFDSVNFNQANLQNADFENSSLRYASFLGADLSGANFANTKLTDGQDVDFEIDEHTVLRGTNFTGAVLRFKYETLTTLLKNGLQLQGMVLIDVSVSGEIKTLLEKHHVIFDIAAIHDVSLQREIIRQQKEKAQWIQAQQAEQKKQRAAEQRHRNNDLLTKKTKSVYDELVHTLVYQGANTLHYGFDAKRLGLKSIELAIVTKLIKLCAMACLAGCEREGLMDRLMRDDVLRPVDELPQYVAHIHACYPIFKATEPAILDKLKSYANGLVLTNTQRDQLFYFAKTLVFSITDNTVTLHFEFDEARLQANGKLREDIQSEIIRVLTNELALFPSSETRAETFSVKLIHQENVAGYLEEDYLWYRQFWDQPLAHITEAGACYTWALRYYYKLYPVYHDTVSHQWLSRALQQNPEHANALRLMGLLHEQGRGCARDSVAAARYFARAQQNAPETTLTRTENFLMIDAPQDNESKATPSNTLALTDHLPVLQRSSPVFQPVAMPAMQTAPAAGQPASMVFDDGSDEAVPDLSLSNDEATGANQALKLL